MSEPSEAKKLAQQLALDAPNYMFNGLVERWTPRIKAALDAAEKRGQLAMRERAAQMLPEDCGDYRDIMALQPEPLPEAEHRHVTSPFYKQGEDGKCIWCDNTGPHEHER